jgi:hypothetical protein
MGPLAAPLLPSGGLEMAPGTLWVWAPGRPQTPTEKCKVRKNLTCSSGIAQAIGRNATTVMIWRLRSSDVHSPPASRRFQYSG